MGSTKADWKETGRDLGHAFKGLGKTILKTAKTGVDKATSWAEDNNQNKDDSVVDVDATVTDAKDE